MKTLLSRIATRAPWAIALLSLALIVEMRSSLYPLWWHRATFYNMLSGEYEGAKTVGASTEHLHQLTQVSFDMAQQYVDGRFNGEVEYWDSLFKALFVSKITLFLGFLVVPMTWLKQLEDEVVRNIET